jgi:acetyltransferase
MDYMIEEPEVGTLVIASAGAGTQIADVIALRKRTDKNMAFFWTASRIEKGTLTTLKESGIPIFYTPDKLARGLKALQDYHAWRDRHVAAGPATVPALTQVQEHAVARLRASPRATLSEKESKLLIAEWGIPVTRELPVKSATAAVEAAELLGYPVALKIDSADIPHKTEAGVVRIGLANAHDVRGAYDEIMTNAAANAPNARVDGELVQEMVTGAVEVIVGIKYDSQLGPMLLFGSGGVMVEVYNDVALRHCPITRQEALAMIDEVKAAKQQRGCRGKPPADVDALADTLVRVSQLAVHLEGELAEVDINPLMVLPKGQGVKAVDALVVLQKRPS